MSPDRSYIIWTVTWSKLQTKVSDVLVGVDVPTQVDLVAIPKSWTHKIINMLMSILEVYLQLATLTTLYKWWCSFKSITELAFFNWQIFVGVIAKTWHVTAQRLAQVISPVYRCELQNFVKNVWMDSLLHIYQKQLQNDVYQCNL